MLGCVTTLGVMALLGFFGRFGSLIFWICVVAVLRIAENQCDSLYRKPLPVDMRANNICWSDDAPICGWFDDDYGWLCSYVYTIIQTKYKICAYADTNDIAGSAQPRLDDGTYGEPWFFDSYDDLIEKLKDECRAYGVPI